jgi:hypothetical protein
VTDTSCEPDGSPFEDVAVPPDDAAADTGDDAADAAASD